MSSLFPQSASSPLCHHVLYICRHVIISSYKKKSLISKIIISTALLSNLKMKSEFVCLNITFSSIQVQKRHLVSPRFNDSTRSCSPFFLYPRVAPVRFSRFSAIKLLLVSQFKSELDRNILQVRSTSPRLSALIQDDLTAI